MHVTDTHVTALVCSFQDEMTLKILQCGRQPWMFTGMGRLLLTTWEPQLQSVLMDGKSSDSPRLRFAICFTTSIPTLPDT